MDNKKQRPYKKRSFSQVQKSQKISHTRAQYFQMLPAVLIFLEIILSGILFLCMVQFPEASLFFLFLWCLGTIVLLAGIFFGYWIKRRVFGELMKQKGLDDIYRTMNPLDFEHYVAERFRHVGYKNIVVTKSERDGGIDIVMNKQGFTYAVQCKKYYPKSFVKIDEIRAFVYAFRKAKKDRGIFVTTAQYSEVARREMMEEGVELIDGRRLMEQW